MTKEVWLLTANRVMEEALETGRWVEVFLEHGVSLVPRRASDLRVVASDEGLMLRDVRGNRIDAPRLCICRVYERTVPAALECMGAACLVSSRMVDLCYDKTSLPSSWHARMCLWCKASPSRRSRPKLRSTQTQASVGFRIPWF